MLLFKFVNCLRENTKTKPLGYVWFTENIKKKKCSKKRFFFNIWLQYEKYQRKLNIIKNYIFSNYLIFI